MDEICIRAECGKTQAEALTTALLDAFSLRISVESVEKGALPRYEMKTKRWVRKQRG
jgi:phenylacetate-coenzyme A ligase PaaK-like adenylate-forming protein